MQKNIAFKDSFFDSLNKLGNQDRKSTIATIKEMRKDISMPSLSVHKIDKVKCDPRFRSARVNSDLRIIFLSDGDYCAVVYVDHHDKAYDWCEGKYYKETVFGAGYIYDEIAENVEQEKLDTHFETQQYAVGGMSPLFEGKISKKEIEKLGITGIHADNILKISDEEIFIEYIQLFPEELQEALLDIYAGSKTFEEVFAELEDNGTKEELNDNLKYSMLQKDSGRRFYVVGNEEELENMAEVEDFKKWTTFLHPSQKKFAELNSHGPVLIEGGPGTGKTVLGIHRAAYLSKNVFKADEGKKILFCTYSKKLARYISDNIEKLYAQRGIKNNVDVMGVDSFVAKYISGTYEIKNSTMYEIFVHVFKSKSWGKYTFDFFRYEYYQVIQRYGITSLEQYILADRKGMKIALTKRQREEVWRFFDEVKRLQKNRNAITFVDRALMLESKIDSGEISPMYDSIIIDEAQDLEPSKLRLLSKCVKGQDNSLMILSDFNQRIFTLRSWRKDANISIVGRTHHLSLNYRTTKQISDYACTIFFQDQEINDYMRDFKSIIMGNDPIVQACKNDNIQTKVIIATITQLQKQGYELRDICVVFPFVKDMELFKNELARLQINSIVLQDDIIPADANEEQVCLCSTKGIKGLEFETVILSSSEKIGTVGALNNDLELYVDADLKKQRECERYVAVTRARDNLFVTYVEE